MYLHKTISQFYRSVAAIYITEVSVRQSVFPLCTYVHDGLLIELRHVKQTLNIFALDILEYISRIPNPEPRTDRQMIYLIIEWFLCDVYYYYKNYICIITALRRKLFLMDNNILTFDAFSSLLACNNFLLNKLL